MEKDACGSTTKILAKEKRGRESKGLMGGLGRMEYRCFSDSEREAGERLTISADNKYSVSKTSPLVMDGLLDHVVGEMLRSSPELSYIVTHIFSMCT